MHSPGSRENEAARELLRLCREMGPVQQVFTAASQVDPASAWPALPHLDALASALHDSERACLQMRSALSYRRLILRLAASAAERAGCETSDSLMQMLAEAMGEELGVAGGAGDAGTCYCSYDIGEKLVHVRRAVGAFGETGLVVWGAALLLSEYIIATAAEFEGKRLLELGAGTGLSGLVAACCAAPAAVTLTDSVPVVLQNLRHNVGINAGAFCGTEVEVEAFDWALPDPGGEQAARLRPDVVLAADCVYGPEVNDVFAPALQRLLSSHSGSDSDSSQVQRKAILVCGERSGSLADFVGRFDSGDWRVQDITEHARAAIGLLPRFCYEALPGDSGKDREIMRVLEITAVAV